MVIHYHDSGDSPGEGHHGTNGKVYVAGEAAEQHAQGQHDDVGILHDEVVDIHGGYVLEVGHESKDGINDHQSDNHAVFLEPLQIFSEIAMYIGCC